LEVCGGQVGRGRPRGVLQLHFHFRCLHHFFRWIQVLWQASALSTLRRRVLRLGRHSFRQSHLAATFPLWPARVALALPDILEETARFESVTKSPLKRGKTISSGSGVIRR